MTKFNTIRSLAFVCLLCSKQVFGCALHKFDFDGDEVEHIKSLVVQHPEFAIDVTDNLTRQGFQAAVIKKLAIDLNLRKVFLRSFLNEDSFAALGLNPALAAMIGTPYELAFKADIEAVIVDEDSREEIMSCIHGRFGEYRDVHHHYCALAIIHGDIDFYMFAELIGTPYETWIIPQLEAAMSDEEFRFDLMRRLRRFGEDDVFYQRYSLFAIEKGYRDGVTFADLIGTSHETAILPQLELALRDGVFRHNFLVRLSIRFEDNHESYQRYLNIANKYGQ
ncbi:MAG: hypothetical protein ACK5O7_00045 [Holosporales bacterium]